MIVAADADYFRGRGAFHLYPHNVFSTRPQRDACAPSSLRPGDYLSSISARWRIQILRSSGACSWTGEPVSAELRLSPELQPSDR